MLELVSAVDVDVVLTVDVDVDVVVEVTDPPAVIAVCACSLLPVMVRTYFSPNTIPCDGVFPSNRAKAPIVIGPL